MTIDKRLLRERAKMRQKRPKFRRQESWRYKRLKTGWRRPIGIDNTMRHHKRGWPKIVRIGYRGPKAVRGLTSTGKIEVLVHNVKELEQVNVDLQVARIASAVGVKKKVDITNRADELHVKIINRPEEALTFATISEISEELLLDDEDIDAKKSSRPRKKKPTSSGRLTDKEIAELDKIESQLAGKATKKPSAKKTTAKPKPSVKKTTTKPKTVVKKTTTKPKTAVKKTTTKPKTAVKKTTTKPKTTAKKTTTKKAPAKPKASTTTKKTTSSKKAADQKKKAASSKKN